MIRHTEVLIKVSSDLYFVSLDIFLSLLCTHEYICSLPAMSPVVHSGYRLQPTPDQNSLKVLQYVERELAHFNPSKTISSHDCKPCVVLRTPVFIKSPLILGFSFLFSWKKNSL